jgi:rhodanese-related sulfurtransferase
MPLEEPEETTHLEGIRTMTKLTLTVFLATIFFVPPLLAREIDEQALPEPKRTSLGLYITASGAFEKWKADPENVKIIDVRTREEFRSVGVPEMAAKVPLSMHPQKFVGQVERYAEPEDTVLVICRSGNRSAVAVEMLARAGFKNAYTVIDGFEGDRNSDPSSPDYGRRTVNGWKNAGLPWSEG